MVNPLRAEGTAAHASLMLHYTYKTQKDSEGSSKGLGTEHLSLGTGLTCMGKTKSFCLSSPASQL